MMSGRDYISLRRKMIEIGRMVWLCVVKYEYVTNGKGGI